MFPGYIWILIQGFYYFLWYSVTKVTSWYKLKRADLNYVTYGFGCIKAFFTKNWRKQIFLSNWKKKKIEIFLNFDECVPKPLSVLQHSMKLFSYSFDISNQFLSNSTIIILCSKQHFANLCLKLFHKWWALLLLLYANYSEMLMIFGNQTAKIRKYCETT